MSDEKTAVAYSFSYSNINQYKKENKQYVSDVYEQYKKEDILLGAFFPINSSSYICKGYMKRIDVDFEWKDEKLFLVFNHKIKNLTHILFNINDILKLYFNPYKGHTYSRRLIVESKEKIDFLTPALNDIRFIIDFSNMEFSGTWFYLNGKIIFYDIRYAKYGVVRKCELICNMTRIGIDFRAFAQEFMIQQYHQDGIRMKVISTKRIDNYNYYAEYNTILEKMIKYLKSIALNPDVNWGWYSEDQNYEEKIKEEIKEEEAKNPKKTAQYTSSSDDEYWRGLYRIISREEIDRNNYGSNFSNSDYNEIISSNKKDYSKNNDDDSSYSYDSETGKLSQIIPKGNSSITAKQYTILPLKKYGTFTTTR